MFSRTSKPIGEAAPPTSGLDISLRLALFYTLYFTVATYGLFALAYLFITYTTQQNELAAVNERIKEYRAWNRELGIEAIGSRFIEQGLSQPDHLFVRLIDRSGNATLLSTPQSGPILDPAKIARLPTGLTQSRVHLGFDPQDSWTVVTGELAPGVRIQAGRSNRGAEVVLHRFRKLFALAAVPTLLLGLLLGIVVGYQSMAPVRQLGQIIRNILQTGDLKQRVAIQPRHNDLNAVGASFNEVLERHSHLIASMRESLDNVSHDLRTPLTRLRATLESGLSNDANISRVCGEGLEECDNVLAMLETLLELGAAESGVLDLARDEVPVRELVEDAAELYELVAEEKGIRIESSISENSTITGDRPRLMRALTNLISNAIKFSPLNSVVKIRTSRENGRLVIEVSDQGVGIPSEDLPRIWERLYRGDASRSTPGLGLGLSFVRAIAEAHGGTASVSSEAGRGSTFRVELPIVDDDPTSQSALR